MSLDTCQYASRVAYWTYVRGSHIRTLLPTCSGLFSRPVSLRVVVRPIKTGRGLLRFCRMHFGDFAVNFAFN